MGEKIGFNPLKWFFEMFPHVNEKALDDPTKKLIKKLGPEGVQNLVQGVQESGSTPFRNERLTKEERVNMLEQLFRLGQEGGGNWAPGQPSIGKDKPTTWLNDEGKYLDDIG